ncbi:MAG: hypothetical protein Q4G52_08345 [Clostridia bacterium]|nr:hypothetical protein [Clostridia bacterium]
MARKFNREKLKAFVERRKINTFGLLAITAISAVITLVCALSGFARTDILTLVTIALILLCMMQMYKMRSSFRTIPSFKGSRKRRPKGDAN